MLACATIFGICWHMLAHGNPLRNAATALEAYIYKYMYMFWICNTRIYMLPHPSIGWYMLAGSGISQGSDDLGLSWDCFWPLGSKMSTQHHLNATLNTVTQHLLTPLQTWRTYSTPAPAPREVTIEGPKRLQPKISSDNSRDNGRNPGQRRRPLPLGPPAGKQNPTEIQEHKHCPTNCQQTPGWRSKGSQYRPQVHPKPPKLKSGAGLAGAWNKKPCQYQNPLNI